MGSSRTHETTLSEFVGETTTESVTRCVVLPLETSKRKTALARECIDEWQAIARKAAELMPSFPHTDGVGKIVNCIGRWSPRWMTMSGR